MAINFLESDIEKMIFENLDTVHERGFIKFHRETFRQHRLESGGIIDLLTFQEDEDAFRFKIIELKRSEINIDTLQQAIKYFDDYTAQHFHTLKLKNIECDIILCGDSISNSMVNLLEMGCNIKVYLYDFNYCGLCFKNAKTKNFDNPSFDLPKEMFL